MNCNICIELIKKDATCLYCNYNVCLQCLKRYFKESNKINCMNCNKEYTRKYIFKNFSKSFLTKEYREIRKNILFKQELSFIQGTHEVIENKNRESKFQNLNFNKNLFETILYYSKRINGKTSREFFQINSEKQIDEINIKLKDFSFNKNNKKQIEFIGKCIINECNGLISKIEKKCTICNKLYCIKCLNQTDDKNHKCNEDTLASINFLKKDSKNCPSCFAKIFKINGCDQMFCTHCKTGFEWQTLNIITGNLHNPHYLEYLKNNRQTINTTCQLELNNLVLTQLTQIENNIDREEKMSITNICRNLMHIRDVNIVRNNNQDDFNINLEDRIYYIKKVLDETKFKQKIEINNKKKEKKQDLNNIYNLMITLATDIILRFTQNYDKPNTYIELANLNKYINNLIEEHKEIFNSTSKKIINKNFEIILI